MPKNSTDIEMKALHCIILCLMIIGFQSCHNQQPASSTNEKESCDNPYTVEKMHLKGAVKMMVKEVYTANIWEPTYYYFAPDGHLDSIAQEITSYGDRRTLGFDACGHVTDTLFFIQFEDGFDPNDPLEEVDLYPTEVFVDSHFDAAELTLADADRHSSETVEGVLIENELSEYGYVTHFKGIGEGTNLSIDFSYEADGVTPMTIHYTKHDEYGDLDETFATKQYDAQGNPILWPVSTPYGPLGIDMFYMFEEFLEGLYVQRYLYEYYE